MLIFFQGTEDQDARQSLSANVADGATVETALEKTAIAYNELPHMPGVQLMVLNVARRPGDVAVDQERAVGDPRIGFMRYEWRDVNEIRNPSPAVLTYIGDAMKKASDTRPVRGRRDQASEAE